MSSPKNKLQDIAILLLISYTFGFAQYLSLLFEQNFGTSELPYIAEITLAAPVAFILIGAVLKKRLKLPYFGAFLLIELLFVLFESAFFRQGNVSDLSYPYGMLILYSIFVALVNYGCGENNLHRIKTYALCLILFIVGTMYLGYFGILNVSMETSDFSFGELSSSRPIGNIMHTNGLSFSCGIGIYLLILSQLSETTEIRERKFWFLVMLFLSVIVVNASMGAFIITSIGVCAYLIKTWSVRRGFTNLAIIYVMLFFFLAVTFPSEIAFFQKFYLFNRVNEYGSFQSRIRQVYVTGVNFINNPWLGVGYYAAARGVLAGYTQSNFHYTQVLATNGIVYFPFYIYFLSKMFGFSFRDLKLFLCMVAGFGALMFYNWALIFSIAVIAYIVYCQKNSQEFESQLEISTSGLEPHTPVRASHSLMGLH